MTGSVGVDNTLGPSLGRISTTLALQLNSAFRQGEQIYVQAGGHPNLDGEHGYLRLRPTNRQLAVGLVMPLGVDGLSFNLEAIRTDSAPNASAGQQFCSQFERYSARLKYALFRSRAFNLSSELAFDAQQETLSLSESDQSRLDRLIGLHHYLRAGRRNLLFGSLELMTNLARIRGSCPGFEAIIHLISRAVALAMSTGTPLSVPPMLLVGPPGTGKTHASRQIASALRTDIHAVSCATNSDAQAHVVGHPASWKAARMGVLTEAMASGSSAQPVVLLDELDKLQTHWSEKPYHTMLTVLERENSNAINDEFVRVPFDLSGTIIIAAANDIEALPDFIVDRLTIFAIPSLVGASLLGVAARRQGRENHSPSGVARRSR